MKYNRDPNFWNQKQIDCNCGSLAFSLDGWYHPGSLMHIDDSDEIYDYLLLWTDEDGIYNDDELSNLLADLYLERIEEDFGPDITPPTITPIDPPREKNKELIAFRAGAYVWGYKDSRDFDYDFHFKVYRDGEWIEKNGSGPVNLCSIDNWDGSMYYNSDTYYFIHTFSENLTLDENDDIL